MRLIARYAVDLGSEYMVRTVFDSKIEDISIPKDNPTLETITDIYPTAIWMERKIYDDFGISFLNSFDQRPLVHQEYFPNGVHPMQKTFKGSIDSSEYIPYQYETIGGDGVFEVSVGPIHAGIIEPGHFHFSQAGEEMLHLEIRHFYTYRGLEKMLEGLTMEEARPIIERISGNETIAYQLAFVDILSQANKIIIPKDIKERHYILLELERIIHHLTDLGFIPNDAGFGTALAFCSMKAEEARREMFKLTGHRFGFGGVKLSTSNIDIKSFNSYLNQLEKDITWFKDWIMDIPSLWDRFDTTGILPKAKAIKYSTVGVVARASGVPIDRREDNPIYKEAGFNIVTSCKCDVSGRFLVRLNEVENSITIIRNLLKDNPSTVELKTIVDGEYSSYIESSIGELFMTITITDGLISRFYARDPSFVNWQAMHIMMPKNIIPDFPLINKSCDLSYGGNDL